MFIRRVLKTIVQFQAGVAGTNTVKTPEEREHIYSDKDLAGFVDMAMGQLDTNGDGFITYPEYIRSEMARNRADDLKAGNLKKKP